MKTIKEILTITIVLIVSILNAKGQQQNCNHYYPFSITLSKNKICYNETGILSVLISPLYYETWNDYGNVCESTEIYEDFVIISPSNKIVYQHLGENPNPDYINLSVFNEEGIYKFANKYNNSVVYSTLKVIRNKNSIGYNENICYQNTASLIQNIENTTNSSGSVTYKWYRDYGMGYGLINGEGGMTYQPPYETKTVKYKRIMTESENNCSVESNEVIKNKYNLLNEGTIGDNQTICYNVIPNKVKFNTNPTGGSGNYTLKWEVSQDGTVFGYFGVNGYEYQPGNLTSSKWYRVKVEDVCGSIYTNNIKISVREEFKAGTIGDEQYICYNEKPNILAFKVNPSGGGGSYTYQWQVSSDGTNFSNITGATATTYQPNNLTSSKWYRVLVSDQNCGSIYTNKIKITVYDDLEPGTIGNNQNICYNTSPEMLRFIVNPSLGNGIYTYQWQESSDGINFIDVAGATATTHQPGNLTASKWYRVKVTSCIVEYTNTVKITVAQPLSLPEINSNKTICYNNSPGTLYLEGTPSGGMGGYSYQWEFSDNGVNYNTITGATNIQYEVGNLTSNKWYRVKVTNACEVKNTNAVKITVYGALSAGVIGDAQTICYNTAPAQLRFNTNPSGGDGSYAYQWQESSDGSSYSNIAGATGTTYQPGNLTATRWYKVSVVNSCGSVTTSGVKITVAGDVNPGEIGDEQSICNGIQPTTIGLKSSPTGGIGGYRYQWEVSNDGANYSSITGATGNTYQPPMLTSSKWYRLSVANQCKTVKTNDVKVTVAEPLSVPTVGSEQSICYNAIPETLTANGNPQGGLGAYTYKWEVSSDNAIFNEIVGANETSYNPGPLTASRWYRMKVVNTCETKSTNSVKVNVYGDVTFGVIGNNQDICNGSTPQGLEFKTNPSGGDGSFTYQWQESSDGVTFNDIYGATGTAYQPSSLTSSKWYRVGVSSTCKSGYTGSVKVNVYAPLGDVVVGDPETVCYGQIPQEVRVTNTITGGKGNYAYQWERKVGYGNWETISGATTSKYQPQALVSNTGYRVKVSDMCGVVISNEVEKTVRDDLQPGIIESEQTICYNTVPVKLRFLNNPNGGSGAYSYQWMESENGSVFYNVEQAIFQDYQPNQLSKTKYYKVKVTDNGGCGTKETNVVVINVLPEVKPGTIGSSQVICYDKIPAIISSVTPATGGNGVFEYQWQKVVNGEWVNISGANNENYQPEALKKTETYRRTANSYGCGSVNSNSVVINVRDKLNPGAIGNNQTIPYGTQPQLLTTTLSANGGSGMFTYQWQVSENKETWSNIANATNEYYQPGTLVKKTQYRRMVKDNECGEEYSNVVEITVLNALNAGIIGENQLICNGSQPNKLVGTEATGGTGTYTYSWLKSTDDNTYALIPGADGRDYQPGPLTQTTYFKRRVENNGDKKESNKVAIEVRAALVEPNLNIKEKYCKNEVVNLLVQNVQNTYQYRWYNENMGEVGLGTSYVLGEISSDRTIYIDATDQNGCMSTRKKVDLLVDKVKAEFNADKNEVKQNEPVQFTNMSMDAQSYVWNFGDGGESNEKDPKYYYQKLYNFSNTYYTVKLRATSKYGCVNEVEKKDYILVKPAGTTGINENESTGARIYPNPIKNELVIESTNGVIERVEMYNTRGELAKIIKVQSEKHVVDMSNEAPGIYLVRIIGKEVMSIKMIVKQ